MPCRLYKQVAKEREVHSTQKQAHTDLVKKAAEQAAELAASRKDAAGLQVQLDDERMSRCASASFQTLACVSCRLGHKSVLNTVPACAWRWAAGALESGRRRCAVAQVSLLPLNLQVKRCCSWFGVIDTWTSRKPPR